MHLRFGRRFQRLRPRVLLGLLLIPCCGLQADVFRGAELRLGPGSEPQTLRLEAWLPIGVDTATAPQWPEDCGVTSEQRRPVSERRLLTFEVRCDASPWQPGNFVVLPWALDGARLLRREQGRVVRLTLRPRDGRILVPLAGNPVQPDAIANVGEALWQGMVHIAIGWDHLSFVLLVCLLVPPRQLLLLITAFTLGHSVSLALAFYELLVLPIKPVEATIALSIVLLAREVLLSWDKTWDKTSDPARDDVYRMPRPYLVITSFGLLHGLGFASALAALGVSGAVRWPLLLGFNLGVEVGQVLFVGLILAVLWCCRRLGLAALTRQALTWGSGSLGAFWLFERLLSLG